MDCTRHFLFFHWSQHDWRRRVNGADDHTTRDFDMWGRPVTGEYVTCHTEYVCHTCGETRDAGACICDRERGDRCTIRLAYRHRESELPRASGQ